MMFYRVNNRKIIGVSYMFSLELYYKLDKLQIKYLQNVNTERQRKLQLIQPANTDRIRLDTKKSD